MLKFAILLSVSATLIYARANLKDDLIDDLIEDYEERHHKRSGHPKTGFEAHKDPRYCTNAGLECYKCSDCHDEGQYGQCIVGATEAKCLCWFGWAGPRARYVPDSGIDDYFGVNRIRADNCRSPCFYNHASRTSIQSVLACVSRTQTTTTPKTTRKQETCDIEDCMKFEYGICVDDKCVCHDPYCKDANGRCIDDKCVICKDEECPDGKKCVDGTCVCDDIKCRDKNGLCKEGECVPCDEYKCRGTGGKCVRGECKCDEDHCESLGGFCHEEKCKKECCYPYSPAIDRTCPACRLIGVNENCGPDVPVCDPKCKDSRGIPDYTTGYCKCCKDYTGPNAHYHDGELYADYCDVFCPHEDGTNKKCTNNGYVERARGIQQG